eukprot:8753275-Alexandrium_andersonii.AAC.1
MTSCGNGSSWTCPRRSLALLGTPGAWSSSLTAVRMLAKRRSCSAGPGIATRGIASPPHHCLM